MTAFEPHEGDDDLIVSDDPGGVADLPGRAIPEKERVVPRVAEKMITQDDGTVVENDRIEPFFWGRAHHNLPGFEQPTRTARNEETGKVEPVTDEAGRPRGLLVGEAGWIPNTEEGINAVAIGFVKVEEPPMNAPDMPPEPKIALEL